VFPEILSQSIILPLTNYFDLERNGWAIEIGVGSDNFYAENFSRFGLQCIAVDPIPYKPFNEIARKNNIYFEEVCIYDSEGEITIYSNDDLSSINPDWWGVDNKNTKKVQSILLSTLINRHKVEKITFLKIDTEGTEYEIIKQLNDLPPALLPKVIEFEYGGGALKETGNAGWNEKYFKKVLAIFEVLKRLEYQQGLQLDSNDISIPFFSLDVLDNPEMLFKPHHEYGNILIFKDAIKDTSRIEATLLEAQIGELKSKYDIIFEENRQLYIQIQKSNYTKRILNRFRRTFGF